LFFLNHLCIFSVPHSGNLNLEATLSLLSGSPVLKL